ncbi:MAG: hypothetical protein ACLFU5_09365, partial [Thermoplasmata archaeon]
REFILDFGMSETDIEVAPSKLYSKNREIIDPQANRYFFIPDPVKIELVGEIETEIVKVARHPSDAGRGYRELEVGREVYIPRKEWEEFQNDEVRLKNFCNLELDGKKGKITGFENKDILKIQWLKEGLDVSVERPDSTHEQGLGEHNLRETDIDDIIQFERYGFVKIQETDPWLVSFGHR